MPTYKFKLKSGKTLNINGDAPPSDEEIEGIAKEAGVELAIADEVSDKTSEVVKTPSTSSNRISSNSDVTSGVDTSSRVDSTPPVTPQTDKTSREPIKKPEPEKGFFGKLAAPLTTAPSEWAHSLAETFSHPGANSDDSYLSGVAARARGFAGGALEGIGDLVSGLTSPVNIAATLTTGGAGLAARAGLPAIAGALGMASRATSVPLAVEGASDLFGPSSTMQERGRGILELGGAAAQFVGVPEKPATVVTTGEKTVARNLDPNFNSGAGDANLAGSVPYSKAVEAPIKEKPVTAADKVVARANETTPSTAPAPTIIIKNGKGGPLLVKNLREKGYEFDREMPNGDVRFKKTGEGTKQPILETEVGQTRGHKPEPKGSPILDALNAPRTAMSSMDFSAPLRQGLGLIHRKEWWQSLKPMFEAFGSENSYQGIMKDIKNDPLFKRRLDGKGGELPSFAEDAGLKLTDLHGLSNREESIMSTFMDKVPGIRASNRAYTAFLNKLRADTFKSLVQDGKVFANAEVDKPLAKALAEYVNTATGRGSLGRAEQAANVLSTAFFSPRMIASRVQMLNPQNYVTGNPFVRKQYAKSMLGIAALGNTFLELGKLAGGQVETDPASSDYGKLKLGNTRIDPWGGFQQYMTFFQHVIRPQAARIAALPHGGTNTGIVPLDLATGYLAEPGGNQKAVNTGVEYSMDNPKITQSNRGDAALRFGRGKLSPSVGMGVNMLFGGRNVAGEKQDFTSYNPLDNTITQLFIPMFIKDVADIIREEGLSAKELATTPLSALGMGVSEFKKERPR